ncbi:DUF4440 domain-containing protein [Variovorax beijingensis]|uniref:DUF4440 domain-containing protein n=1 Tax=Variovorax beijingensis TaxID=2496117 RepID=A0A3P3EVB5_9BURK|nr:nuclear transport factor 2 family protein [Variovorax beijingensis]RRH90360.1 DUF4440 domain-containing protein [Variovorax beijingensis]
MNGNAKEIAATLLAIEREINERWNKGDVDGALEVYSDDVTYFDPMTETRLEGRKTVEAYFRQFFEGKLNILRNDFLDPQVIASEAGDMALVSYNLVNHVSDGQGGEKLGSSWNATMGYRKIDGRWRAVHVNWSFTRHPAAMQGLKA